MNARMSVCVVVAAVVGVATGPEASASSPTVEVEYLSPMGDYSGYEYYYLEGVMRGTIDRDGTTGSYEIPISMAYPENGSNGLGVLDVASTAYAAVHVDEEGRAILCGRGIPFCDEGEIDGRRIENTTTVYGLVIPEGYLFHMGYTFLAIQVDKGVTDVMGPEPPDGTQRRRMNYGTIEEAFDAFDITEQAAQWMRDPSEFIGHGAPDVPASDSLIAHGFSGTSFWWRSWLQGGHNEDAEGDLIYDAFLLTGGGAMCLEVDEEGPLHLQPIPCPGYPDPGDAKVIAIDAESDPEVLAGGFARDSSGDPNHVRWELAGVSHIPASLADMGFIGATNQNRVELNPVHRAGIFHLKNWLTEGVEPPPSKHLEGNLNTADGRFHVDRDSDGNAIGGLRLPHMPRTLDDGTVVGAPVGTYTGTDWDAMDEDDFNLFVALGGTFIRFSDERLDEMYPTREAYLERYIAALDLVVEEGYVLDYDYDRYVQLAEGTSIGSGEPEPDAGPGNGIDDSSSGGCSMTSASALSNTVAALGLCFVVGLLVRTNNRRRYARR